MRRVGSNYVVAAIAASVVIGAVAYTAWGQLSGGDLKDTPDSAGAGKSYGSGKTYEGSSGSAGIPSDGGSGLKDPGQQRGGTAYGAGKTYDGGSAGEGSSAGATGPAGPAGPAGPPGPRGHRGEKGSKGDDGDEGDKGDKGDTGPAGAAATQRYASVTASGVADPAVGMAVTKLSGPDDEDGTYVVHGAGANARCSVQATIEGVAPGLVTAEKVSAEGSTIVRTFEDDVLTDRGFHVAIFCPTG